jgi:tetratricopeptide (TPR) repeat protein
MVGSTDSPKNSLMKSIEYSKKAIAMDETLSSAHGFLGFLYANIRRYDEGVALCQRGVELGPTDEAAHRYLALALRYSGKWDEALRASQRAVRLNPFPDSGTLHGLGIAYAFTGQYEKAIEACKEATLKNPQNLVSQVALAMVYGIADRTEEAKQTGAEVIQLDPAFSAESYVKRLKYRRKEDSEKILNSLKKAGL